eukprot:472026-Rhodomonas_salina.1
MHQTGAADAPDAAPRPSAISGDAMPEQSAEADTARSTSTHQHPLAPSEAAPLTRAEPEPFLVLVKPLHWQVIPLTHSPTRVV